MEFRPTVEWIGSGDFDGWGAETLGALIGGLFSVLVAYGVARRETRRAEAAAKEQRVKDLQDAAAAEEARKKVDQQRWLAEWQEKRAAVEARSLERRAGIEAKRLDQFVKVLLAIQDVAPAINRPRQEFDEAIAEIEKSTMAWSAYLIDEEELVFEDLFRRCTTALLKVARGEYERGGTAESFRAHGHAGRQMQDGIVTHGKMWHADPGRRAEATTWFDANAWKF